MLNPFQPQTANSKKIPSCVTLTLTLTLTLSLTLTLALTLTLTQVSRAAHTDAAAVLLNLLGSESNCKVLLQRHAQVGTRLG